MKLNNKGITLIEIIISIVLISIVLISLFSLLITVKDLNEEADINASYLINKSLIIKNIEEDLYQDTDGINITNCEIKNFYPKYDNYKNSLDNNLKANECIKITYGTDGDGNIDEAFLGIYYYKNQKSYVISYIHNNVRATRILDKFENYNVDGSDIKNANKIKLVNNNANNTGTCIYPSLSSSCSNTSAGFYKIEVPIIGSDGKDYTIIISYYGKVSVS